MTPDPKIAILLSTYNGARYLTEQLDSLLQQSYANFVVVARDDGSTDNTREVLAGYAADNGERFCLLEGGNRNLGASASFSLLIEYVLDNKSSLSLDPAYMMFCDQDDVWYPDKVERQVRRMLRVEKDRAIPVLVHSDLRVVSAEMQPIAESYVRFQGLEIERNRFPNLVISNLVTGCTALINESLARKAIPVDGLAIMHDWWLAMVATAFGRLEFLDEPLVHYRQHGSNTIGAREFIRPGPVSRSFWARLVGRKPNEHLSEVARQARAFRRRFGRELATRDRVGLMLACWMAVPNGALQRISYRLARRF